MPHHKARFTAHGRAVVVCRVVEHGETFAQAAAWASVSTSTVWEWVRRWRAACPEDRRSLACLQERSSRPHRSPTRVPAERSTGSASCANRPAGARGGWLTSSAGRTRPSSRARSADCSRAPVSSERWVGTGGLCPGTCCTWTPRSSELICAATARPAATSAAPRERILIGHRQAGLSRGRIQRLELRHDRALRPGPRPCHSGEPDDHRGLSHQPGLCSTIANRPRAGLCSGGGGLAVGGLSLGS